MGIQVPEPIAFLEVPKPFICDYIPELETVGNPQVEEPGNCQVNGAPRRGCGHRVSWSAAASELSLAAYLCLMSGVVAGGDSVEVGESGNFPNFPPNLAGNLKTLKLQLVHSTLPRIEAAPGLVSGCPSCGRLWWGPGSSLSSEGDTQVQPQQFGEDAVEVLGSSRPTSPGILCPTLVWAQLAAAPQPRKLTHKLLALSCSILLTWLGSEGAPWGVRKNQRGSLLAVLKGSFWGQFPHQSSGLWFWHQGSRTAHRTPNETL